MHNACGSWELMFGPYPSYLVAPYLIGLKVIVYTDHAELKYLMRKREDKSGIIQCIFLMQEFENHARLTKLFSFNYQVGFQYSEVERVYI
jgi:hypothetical protein